MNQSEKSPTSEELKNLETDPVWGLLDEASNLKAGPMFANSIMHEIRSETAEATENVVTVPSFWKRYTLQIAAVATAGVAACVMLTLNSETPETGDLVNVAPISEFSDADLDFIAENMPIIESELTSVSSEIDVLADEMIEIDNEDPFFMSADDINVLITM